MTGYEQALRTLKPEAGVPLEAALRNVLLSTEHPMQAVGILAAYRILRDPDLARRWKEEEQALTALPESQQKDSIARDSVLCLGADPATQGRFVFLRDEIRAALKSMPGVKTAPDRRIRRYLASLRAAKARRGVLIGICFLIASIFALGICGLIANGEFNLFKHGPGLGILLFFGWRSLKEKL